MIDVKTKLVGLLGYPLGHSLSPLMQNKAFKLTGLNCLYLPIEAENKDYSELLSGMKKMNFIGFNVTIPGKIDIIQHLDAIHPLAEKIGSVNTVQIENGRMTGYNTDGEGFVSSLTSETRCVISESSFMVLGAGGACRAIAMTLAEREAKKIVIANRTFIKAKALCDEINGCIRDCCIPLALSTEVLAQYMPYINVLINTTNIGLFPNVDNTPIDHKLLRKDLLVADIIYNPIRTRMLIEAEEIGCVTLSGIGMFVNQGVEAFKIWTGIDPPVREMREIVEQFLLNKQ
ncbi:MAG: Shikimate dehydrogenase [Clostridiales bacterium 38_11]|nr:MAG: Shikimate dehydrogenase [Clostridiales bacterium 38_11]HBH12391.1 shikimate dehydrogenase [Clostridiales bacterium]